MYQYFRPNKQVSSKRRRASRMRCNRSVWVSYIISCVIEHSSRRPVLGARSGYVQNQTIFILYLPIQHIIARYVDHNSMLSRRGRHGDKRVGRSVAAQCTLYRMPRLIPGEAKEFQTFAWSLFNIRDWERKQFGRWYVCLWLPLALQLCLIQVQLRFELWLAVVLTAAFQKLM